MIIPSGSYESYVRYYKSAQAQMKKNGYEMVDNQMYSKYEYAQFYEATVNDMKKEIAAGTRKGYGNLPQIIASRQRWHTTERQAAALQKAFMEFDKTYVSIADIRGGSKKFAAAQARLDEYYQNLRKEGYSGRDAKLIISQAFFGS